MNILALETSTEYCSVALWQNGHISLREEHAGQRHSQLLLPQCQSLLREANIQFSELNGIAYTRGPGSFTGLRIGCSVAQGLAFAANVPVVGISSLLAIAANTQENHVIACLDARMGEVYFAAYQREGDVWQEFIKPQVCKPEAVPRPDEPVWVGCGNGFLAHADTLHTALSNSLISVSPILYPHARQIAQLAAIEFRSNRGVAPEAATPLYVRDRVALKICERG